MWSVQYQQVTFKDNILYLEHSHSWAQVTLLPGGVWRILAGHRLQDRQKGSHVIKTQERLPFECQQIHQTVLLEAPEIMPLTLELSPFRWQWGAWESSQLLSGLGQPLNQPVSRELHPVQAENDGLPVGNGYTWTLPAQTDDHYYGLGERTGFLDKKGRRWVNWTTDESNHQPNADPLYQAHPFMLGHRENTFAGFYLDETWYSSFDLGFSDPDNLQWHTAGPTLDLYVIPGPAPAQVLEHLSQLTGRIERPPLWALGTHQCRWSYPQQSLVTAVAQEYRRHDLPLEAIWLDIDYMDGYKVFTFSPERFPHPEQLVAELREQGIRTVVIVDPGVKQEAGYAVYESGSKIQAFVRNERDEELVGEVWPKPAVWPDFSRATVRQWWAKWLAFYTDKGIAGIWNDMNEPSAFNWKPRTLPLKSRQGSGTHAEFHNLYGSQMALATWQGLKQQNPDKRPFILTRSGFSGIQRHAWVWTGDNSSCWEHLEMSIPMLLNLGLSGVPLVGADIGGFFGHADGELLARWTWLGAFYPFMRNHSGKTSRRQEPWEFGEPWLSIIRSALRFRYTLLPYLYTLADEASQNGYPLWRPLWWEPFAEPITLTIHDQFFLGEALMVAPVLRPQQSQRLVWFPAGQWQDFWSGQMYAGPEWHIVPVVPENIPVFQRAGTAIPLTTTALSTTSAWWSPLIWRVVPGEQIQGQVFMDDGDGYAPGQRGILQGTHKNGAWELTCDVWSPERPMEVEYWRQGRWVRDPLAGGFTLRE